MTQTNQAENRLPDSASSPVCSYWVLAAFVCAASVLLSVWLSLTALGAAGARSGLAVFLAVAILLWLFHLPRLPKAGSIRLRRGLPPPVSWVMLVAAIAASLLVACVWKTPVAVNIPAAFIAAALALIGYSLLLPRMLSSHALKRLKVGPRAAVASEMPTVAPQAQSAPPTKAAPGPALLNASRAPPPWDAPIHDPERERRLFRWIAASENPLESTGDDLFDVKRKATRLLELLRPSSPVSGAGTVNIVGQRGSGKSTLLRLADELEKTAHSVKTTVLPVEMRFCFISLWDYSNPRAAMRGAIDEALEIIRDRIDILPIAGISSGVVRAIFGSAGIPTALGGFSPPSLDLWIPALSELLVRANLRIIFCVEDDDRITTSARRADHGEIMQGFLGRLKRFPGFGYVICTSTPAWAEPSLDEPGSASSDKPDYYAENWKNYNGRWRAAYPDGELRTEKLPPMTPEELATLREEVGEIIVQGRLRWAEQTGFLPVSRLCQYDMLTDGLKAEDIEPVLKVFRTWMVRQAHPDLLDLSAAVDLCGIGTKNRQDLFTAFIDDHSESGMAQYITLRTLRNALRDAHRRWENITAVLRQGGEGWERNWTESGIDFDSVLVACLLRACFPERWPDLLRLAGNQTWVTSFHRNVAAQITGGYRGLWMMHGEVVSQLRELYLQLGLSGSVWNMLSIQDLTDGHEVRPGGIVGNGAQKNWKLFIGS